MKLALKKQKTIHFLRFRALSISRKDPKLS